jgi:HTH-type transcriptional regulator, competence development regulator
MAKKKSASSGQPESAAHADPQTLGDYLAAIRGIRLMTLREVEEATGNEVSNAYLSQLEKNKITRPSPNILHALALVYVIPYETLMEKAGYISPTSTVPDALRSAGVPRHGRAATFTDANLTQEEEASLLEYLAFLRTRRGKGGKT